MNVDPRAGSHGDCGGIAFSENATVVDIGGGQGHSAGRITVRASVGKPVSFYQPESSSPTAERVFTDAGERHVRRSPAGDSSLESPIGVATFTF